MSVLLLQVLCFSYLRELLCTSSALCSHKCLHAAPNGVERNCSNISELLSLMWEKPQATPLNPIIISWNVCHFPSKLIRLNIFQRAVKPYSVGGYRGGRKQVVKICGPDKISGKKNLGVMEFCWTFCAMAVQKVFPPQEILMLKKEKKKRCWKEILEAALVWSQALLPLGLSTHKAPWIWMCLGGQGCTSFCKLSWVSSWSFPGLSVPQEGGTICLLLSVPVELQAKRLGGSPGAELLHVLPKWPINYLFTCFEYLQLQQKKPRVKLMTLDYFICPNCLVLLIISTFWIQIVLAVS